MAEALGCNGSLMLSININGRLLLISFCNAYEDSNSRPLPTNRTTYPTALDLPGYESMKSLYNGISYCFCDTAADITYSTDPTVSTDPTDPTDPISLTDRSY
jgi:hypothetical protein